ncbi:hypothetical protein GOODEAATRI_003331, partial [Goodea atripinnis]
KQVNSDEGMSSGKGSNEVISYMHHFLTHFGFGETDVDLHCDNCTGQNKNNFMLWYGAWRVAHKLHSTLNIHFPIAGHTKFAPDCGFGPYQTSIENQGQHIGRYRQMENISPESRLNIPQLVGLEDGRVLVNTFDWQAHLSPYFRKLPQIKSCQHFRYLLCRLPVICVPALPAPGLAKDRQTYLYSKIRPFCSDEAKDITCPAPQSTTMNSTQKRMMV